MLIVGAIGCICIESVGFQRHFWANFIIKINNLKIAKQLCPPNIGTQMTHTSQDNELQQQWKLI